MVIFLEDENFRIMISKSTALSAILLVMTPFLEMKAQICFNGVSTDPMNPFNNDTNYPTSNNLWINTFNIGPGQFGFSNVFLNPDAGWSIPDFTSPAQFQMFNPFTTAGAPGTLHLAQPVTPFQNRDYHWEDGWELLYLSTGYYPIGWPLQMTPQNAPITSGHSVMTAVSPT